MHLQAWTNQQIKATKETGQGKNKKSVPVYKNFKDFFNYEKRMKQIDGKTTKEDKEKKRLAEVAKRLNQRA
ncbi:hypothetical protein DT065_00420 [Salicibibacter kimchii]|uniref:Uncharacterized protein n=1 Tax=Salicibibacter kimchii TaxID=2099786 RepID=A0A345C3L4_9BACI|nr:hypothetical protein DT065_00420 [Salicibibacter kimchii]